MRRAILTALAVLAPILACTGCGSSNAIPVTGKLLKGGVPYTPPEGQKLAITLYAMDVKDAQGKSLRGNEPFQAMFNPKDSTFSVPGPEGYGVPAGKYRIAVSQTLKGDALKREEVAARKNRKAVVDRDTDMLKNQFSAENSPIVRVVEASGNLTIDLDKPGETPHSP
jgi:hypothetical protein